MANLEPFLPGLLTVSSSKVPIATQLFSDLPLPGSPLESRDETDWFVKKHKDRPQNDALVLGGALRVIVGIVSKLENVGRKRGFLVGGIAMLCRIFEENGIRVAGDAFLQVTATKADELTVV